MDGTERLGLGGCGAWLWALDGAGAEKSAVLSAPSAIWCTMWLHRALLWKESTVVGAKNERLRTTPDDELWMLQRRK